MDARLEVSVGANIADLSKGLANGAKQVSDFSKSATKDLARLDAVSKSGGQSLDKFSKGSNTAAFALTNLGRVAQDAPFGFIGIQNNLNPLLESFQQLRKESGSNVGALKELGKSLIGPAGLGIALSVVGAAILFYNEYQRKSKKATEEATKATQEYKDTLTGLNKTQFDAVASSGEEISRLDTLFRATQNLSLSLKDRQLAVNELQRQYPNYFANLTIENALTEKSTENYNKLKKEIVATALARAADKDTAKQGELIFENLAKSQKAQSEINKLNKENARLNAIKETSSDDLIKNAKSIKANEERLSELNKETKDYAASLKNANTAIFNNSQLQDAIVRKFGVQSILPDAKNKATNTSSDLKTRVKITPVNTKNEADEYAKTLEEFGLIQFNKALAIIEKNKKEPLILPIPLEPIFVNPETISDLDIKKLVNFEKLETDITNLFANIPNALADTLSEGFEAVGAAFASGGNPIEAFGSVVLGSFGAFLSEFGKLLIQYGTAGVALSLATKALANPITALPAGLAAIAAGAALTIAGGAIKSFASGQGSGGSQGGYKIPKFANGVSNFGGGMAMVGERGRELVSLPGGSNVITNENIKRYGNRSSQSNVFIADTVIRGNDIVTSFRRSEKKLGKII